MIYLNLRKKEQTKKEESIGYQCIYKSSNKNFEEFFSHENIYRLRYKYGLEENSDVHKVLKEVYNYFNNTLRPGEHKRKLIKIFIVYESKTYIKLDI